MYSIIQIGAPDYEGEQKVSKLEFDVGVLVRRLVKMIVKKQCLYCQGASHSTLEKMVGAYSWTMFCFTIHLQHNWEERCGAGFFSAV